MTLPNDAPQQRPTPRTDKACVFTSVSGKKRKQDFVLTSFARTLERELAAERELANAMALVIAAQLEPMCKVACVLPPFRENGCSADLQDTAIEKLQAALARHAAARAIQP